MATPLLSVVLPAYNAEAYLEPALRSVLEQSFRDFELIVIDDGSTDRTGELLGNFDDRRLQVIRHELNAGLIAGLNEGIEASRGRYIARMDADDICEPTRFQRQIDCLETHPEIGVLGTAIRVIDDQGRPGAAFVMPVTPTDVEWAIPMLCPLAHPSVMMRTEFVKRAEGYSPAALHAEDYDLWCRLSRLTQIANLREPLVSVRKHAASVTSALRHTHLDAAAMVAKAEVDRRLNQDVPVQSIRCMRSWGQTDSEYAMQAVKILCALLEKLSSARSVASTKTASRDAAIRIAYLTRYVAGRERIHTIRAAHNAHALVGAAIVHKSIQRLMPKATRNLIG